MIISTSQIQGRLNLITGKGERKKRQIHKHTDTYQSVFSYWIVTNSGTASTESVVKAIHTERMTKVRERKFTCESEIKPHFFSDIYRASVYPVHELLASQRSLHSAIACERVKLCPHRASVSVSASCWFPVECIVMLENWPPLYFQTSQCIPMGTNLMLTLMLGVGIA